MSGAGLAAVDYARRGWRVFPCHSPVGGRCSCGAGGGCASPAKHPRTRHGLHDASADEDVVRRWWRRWPNANVGLRTGAGLVVVDVDPDHGGTQSLAELERAVGALPATMTVRTGGGGVHLYFAHPGQLRNSAGALGPGLDVRGEGGYVIAPPSWHIAGTLYRCGEERPLARLPAALVERLQPPVPPRPAVDPGELCPGPQASAWAASALAGEVERVAGAPVGQRNHTLNRSAFVLGQIVGGGHLDATEVAELLQRAGQACGLGAREVAATVGSGIAAGQRWPRHPTPRPQPLARASRRAAPGARPDRSERERRSSSSPSEPPTLGRFVDECAERLWRPEGASVRRWLVAHLGVAEEVLAANRLGADPGGHVQARPEGMPGAGPAVVLPAMEGGRAVWARLRPLHPGGGGRELSPLPPLGPAPSVALLRPPASAGPCVLVADGILAALAACNGGYQGAAALGPTSGGAVSAAARELFGLGTPVVLAFGATGSSRGEALRTALVERGARVARLHLPVDGDLAGWMSRSADWHRELSNSLRTAWASEHRPRRLVR